MSKCLLLGTGIIGLSVTQHFSNWHSITMIAQIGTFSRLWHLHSLYPQGYALSSPFKFLWIVFHICFLVLIPRPSFSSLHNWGPVMASLMNSCFFLIQSIWLRSARFNSLWSSCTTGNLHSKACKGFYFSRTKAARQLRVKFYTVLIISLSLGCFP